MWNNHYLRLALSGLPVNSLISRQKINIRKRKIIQYQDEIEQIEIARDNDVAELIEQVKLYSTDHPEFVHDHAISIQIHNVKVQAQNDIDYIKRRIKKLQCEIGEIREDHDTK